MEYEKKLKPIGNIALLVFIIGIISFASYIPIGKSSAWGVLMTGFIFVLSITQGAMAMAVILRITSSRWSASFYRVALTIGTSFFPFGLISLAAIFVGLDTIFYWAKESHHPYQQPLFFMIRNSLLFLTAYIIAFRISSTSNNTSKLTKDDVPALNNKLLLNGFYLLLALAFFETILSWDLGMTLNQHWADTMYSVQFMMTSLYAGIALLSLIILVAKNYLKSTAFTDVHVEYIGGLKFAFTVIWTFFWFATYFNIWYVNIPEETGAVFLRIYEQPYRPVFLLSLVLLMAVPFFRFLYHKFRKSEGVLIISSLSVLLGVFIERYLIVVPALVKNEAISGFFVFNPFNVLFCAGLLAGTFYMVATRIKKNPKIIPDEQALETDALYIDPEGWQ